MANLNIELPDDLARKLAGLAAAEHKSVQELAVERLRSLTDRESEPRRGSPSALLRAMQQPPHLTGADVDELDAAIAQGRLPGRSKQLFQD